MAFLRNTIDLVDIRGVELIVMVHSDTSTVLLLLFSYD